MFVVPQFIIVSVLAFDNITTGSKVKFTIGFVAYFVYSAFLNRQCIHQKKNSAVGTEFVR